MPTFALRKLDSVKGRLEIVELVIDNLGQLELYEKELETKYKSHYLSLLHIMNEVARGTRLPDTKFHHLKNTKGSVGECEFKFGDLRLYAIQKTGGLIIILGGYKNTQPKDISKFRGLKNQYLNSL